MQGLSQYRVTSVEDVLALLRRGATNRAVRATDYNLQSSRSHALLQLSVEVQTDEPAGGGETPTPGNGGLKQSQGQGQGQDQGQGQQRTVLRRAKLNLIDLAGSEKWSDGAAVSLRIINQSTTRITPPECLAYSTTMSLRPPHHLDPSIGPCHLTPHLAPRPSPLTPPPSPHPSIDPAPHTCRIRRRCQKSSRRSTRLYQHSATAFPRSPSVGAATYPTATRASPDCFRTHWEGTHVLSCWLRSHPMRHSWRRPRRHSPLPPGPRESPRGSV